MIIPEDGNHLQRSRWSWTGSAAQQALSRCLARLFLFHLKLLDKAV
jgi:hypothetical protein